VVAKLTRTTAAGVPLWVLLLSGTLTAGAALAAWLRYRRANS
jgi:hypothetical protein